MKIIPKEDYRLLGTDLRLDSTRAYKGRWATNIPQWRKDHKIFVGEGDPGILLKGEEYLVLPPCHGNRFVRSTTEGTNQKLLRRWYLRDTRIVCGFPGVGKSFLSDQGDPTIRDSDSSTFDKDLFPMNYVAMNYVDYLQDLSDGLILCRSHNEVREELARRCVPYGLVYPHASLREAYIRRYRHRGSPTKFICLLEAMFYDWVRCCDKDEHAAFKIVLFEEDQYLSQLSEEILR